MQFGVKWVVNIPRQLLAVGKIQKKTIALCFPKNACL